MDTETLMQAAESALKPIATEIKRLPDDRVDAILTADKLPVAVQALRDRNWGYLSAITGLDHPAPPPKPGEEGSQEGHIEVLYHFCEGNVVTTLRVTVAYGDARVPTICHLIPSATLFERELSEMLGVTVVDTPVTDHLLLPDGWPQGVYPLRKSFTGKVEIV